MCFQAGDGIRGRLVTGVQTCALPICGDLEDVVGAKAHDQATVGPAQRAVSTGAEVAFDGLAHPLVTAAERHVEPPSPRKRI